MVNRVAMKGSNTVSPSESPKPDQKALTPVKIICTVGMFIN